MKYSIIFNTTLAVLLASTAIASQEDDMTPVRTIAAVTIDSTPGQKLSQNQAQVLNRDEFVKVFDPTNVDRWQINWSIFQDQSIPFDAPQKRVVLKRILDKLNTTERITLEQHALYGQVAGFKNEMDAVHAKRLDALALSYFGNLFPHAKLIPEMKLGGVQLGERIIVNQGQPDTLTYHVKTHSAGRLSSNSTAAKTVNPKELLAYRILEHLGIGCETHFFQRSSEDVYIATLDAGTGGQFHVFEKVSGSKYIQPNEDLARSLAGFIVDINKDPYQLDHNYIESHLPQDPIAQNFIHQMAFLDIITRILRLHDLLNNPGNWGFFQSEKQHYPAIRVIDFRLIDDPQLTMTNENWGSFLEGNGLYQYAGSHKIMRYVLHDRPRASRVETARVIVESGMEERFQKAVRLAYRDALDHISQTMFQKEQILLKLSLDEYLRSIQNNITFFGNKVRKWTPEINPEDQNKRKRQEETEKQAVPKQPSADKRI